MTEENKPQEPKTPPYRDDVEAARERVSATAQELEAAKKDLKALEPEPPKPSPLREIVQPFIDLVHAPRALWAINLNYLLEGFVYFGMVIYLGMFFNKYVGLDDTRAGWMVGVLTSGITISMLFFGGRADKWGVRSALLISLCFMFVGRIILSAASVLGLEGGAILSPENLVAVLGILVIVIGYGMYQPASYAAARQFTTPATANMAYAMLYAVMNLGGWLPTFMSTIRKDYGIRGAYWFYTGITLVGLVVLFFMLSRRTVEKAIADAKAGASTDAGQAKPGTESGTKRAEQTEATGDFVSRTLHWLKNHPLADGKFSFFIFCLIPVQTLFAYNWLVLPQYVNRAFAGSWVGDRFEWFTNLNSLLIFILCPIVAAVTTQRKVYNMMILGTAVMAAPTFFLAIGPTIWGLFAFIVFMTIGEAMWQPRFLQYAAEIAPEGRTGAYMGVAQFPWFLTKMLVPIYSGAALARWCPEPGHGPNQSGTMWLIYGCVAMMSTVMLILSKEWIGKDFKTKSDK
jgi:proton-dependent oligopeptide transporter, POT family